ncbi:DUF4160 domain-containing protein [Dyadobacter arcticus]|uniref:DUF4160 domain-containing protein n=1 Tax=Dyadobacter arcticus TaxID=1078754 RepID=A0ABX0UJN4_9BACT|nr:DUF4160 domain-containing protein [Dyadobacter arcticus]NIJ53223.1 hypothetical protein [Dyadobacter arcticus]
MRFFFYSLEHLPIHIHVRNSDGVAKFEVSPIRLIESHGMKTKDLLLAEALIEKNKEQIITKWHEFHRS